MKALRYEKCWDLLHTLDLQTFPDWEIVVGDSLVGLVLWCHFRSCNLETCLLSLCLKPTLMRLLINYLIKCLY